MAHLKRKLTVKNKQGLHVTVRRDQETVNGKSIMGILMLGAEYGTQIVIEVEGDDAENALNELEKIVNTEE
jgi:phosphocarrier protein